MLRPDLWCWSAARLEIDHRAREARLRLERLERLLMLHVLPTPSWPKRVLQRRRLRRKPIDEDGSARPRLPSHAPFPD
jgi:hypothetical protein